MWGLRPHMYRRDCYSEMSRQGCCRALQTECFRACDKSPEVQARTVPEKRKPYICCSDGWVWSSTKRYIRPQQQAASWLLCPSLIASGQPADSCWRTGAMQFLLMSRSETKICWTCKIPATSAHQWVLHWFRENDTLFHLLTRDTEEEISLWERKKKDLSELKENLNKKVRGREGPEEKDHENGTG